jgi:hypothetical protein
LAILGEKENRVAIETLAKVGGVSIISDRMCEVAIPLQKISNTIKKICNITITNNLRKNSGLAKSKFQNASTTQDLEKN